MVGHEYCGKSSIIKRFTHNCFDENYISTIGALFMCKDINCNGK